MTDPGSLPRQEGSVLPVDDIARGMAAVELAADHTACQAAHNAMYEAAVEAMENPGLMAPRDAFEYRLGTAGHLYHRDGWEATLRERNDLADALEDLHRYSLIPSDGYAGSPCEAKVRAALEAIGRSIP